MYIVPFRYTEGVNLATGDAPSNQTDNVIDIREYDVPYHVRVAIDNKINVGHWYNVRGRGSQPPEILLVEDEPDRPVSVYITPGVYRLDCSVLPLSCTETLWYL